MGDMQQQVYFFKPYNVGNLTAYVAHFTCNNTYQRENVGYNGTHTYNGYEDDMGYGTNNSETTIDSKDHREESDDNTTVDTFDDIEYSQDTTMDTKMTMNTDNTDHDSIC
jgi:hypothetical protein